ncbi:nuclease-related domain-containing protein [Streptomyces evansiae]|uniref:nuclease-related domain-containing protein n=1 Tax=Streptomyces evansiae TaxID=3075535 RepID=UPI0028868D38|nr:nuclease-related domain-containing protein [Streptomyces sp. DSM 41859]MDT0422945.1 nuclease-related domain-containing protein [Streptomyces sp. DSM 41859]
MRDSGDLSARRAGDAVRRKLIELEPNPLKRAVVRRRRGSDLWSWSSGLAGEQFTGKRLNRLRRHGWYVLHALQWPTGTDVDHLAIGPAGVFSINSKRHKDKKVWYGDRAITVNGNSTPHIAASLAEARRVSDLLSRRCGTAIPVRPVIAVIDAAKVTVKNANPPVLVVEAPEIGRLLSGLTPSLDRDLMTRVYEVARREETWLSPR